jgi:hypothetical protein
MAAEGVTSADDGMAKLTRIAATKAAQTRVCMTSSVAVAGSSYLGDGSSIFIASQQ